MQPARDKRRFWRATFNTPARLAGPDGDIAVDVIDVCLQGALVEAPQDWRGRLGTPCRLKIALSDEISIELAGTIAHLQERRVGVRCDHIDIDSITHLRRLVELNAGDPALLEREMSSLLAS